MLIRRGSYSINGVAAKRRRASIPFQAVKANHCKALQCMPSTTEIVTSPDGAVMSGNDGQ